MKAKGVISEIGSLIEGLVYATFQRHRMSHWSATTEEAQMALPGDTILTEPRYSNTLAVIVDAQPDAIWPWILQMGQDRAGYYTHSWLENLLLCKMPSVHEIVSEWQQRAVGDFVPTWRGKLGWTIAEMENGQSISYRNGNSITMTVFIIPTNRQGSRLLMRLRTAGNSNPLMRLSESLFWNWAHCFMGHGVLEGIRQRVEKLNHKDMVD